MALTKLDAYNYTVLPGIIRIKLDGTNDPDLVDIFSEIDNSGGNIYIDGYYYRYLDRYEINNQWTEVYLELYVVEMV